MPFSRRRFFALLPPAVATLFLAACGGDEADSASSGAAPATPDAEPTMAEPKATAPGATLSGAGSTGGAAAAQLAPTPACGDDDEPTPAQTEGPYFTPDSPPRTSLLEAGLSGQLLRLEGYVFGTDCSVISGALLDFWQADDAGQYDNEGYRRRGHQLSDVDGRFTLETILPGLYPGRTRHIHVKVQAPGGPVLTTQLYFPDEPENDRDAIFDPSLVVQLESSEPMTARFDFVLQV